MQSGHSRLQLMGLITAAAMLLLGIALVEPSLAARIALPGYELTGAFLIIQAALLGVLSLPGAAGPPQSVAQVSARLTTNLLGIAFGSLDLFLAGSGLFDGHYALLLFAVPGALLWARSIGDTASQDAQEEDDAVSDESKIVVTSDEGRPDPIGTLRSNAWSSAYTGVMIAVMAAILIPGMLLFRLLQRELVEGQAVGLTGLARALGGLADTAFWLIPALAVIIPLVLLLFGAAVALSQWLVKRRHARATRDLTDDEIAFVERAYAALHAYATARGYERWSILTILLPLVALVGGIAVFGVWGRDWFGAAAFVYMPPAGDPPSWRLVMPGSPASVVPGVFFAIAGVWALHHAACQLWPRYAEFITWGTRTIETDGLNLRQALVRAVRVGSVRVDTAFSPAMFLQQLSAWNARHAYASAMLTGVPTLVLLERDLRNYQLFTDSHVEVVDYWSGQPLRFPYGSVVKVNLECFPKSKGGVDIEYEIELPSDRSIDLIVQADLPSRLADFERVDRNLRAAGARFSYNVRKPPGRPEFPAFSEQCLSELTADADPATAQRIKTLFHLEEWRARRVAE